MKEDDVKKLCNFVGYGSKQPKIVFLGLEEGLPKESDIHLSIQTRLRHFSQPVMDIGTAHAILQEHANVRNPFERAGSPVQQWTTAATFAIALEKQQNATTPADYWRKILGRADSKTLLTECHPLPRPNTGCKIDGYKPQSAWQKYRRDVLRSFFQNATPTFLVAYGRRAHQRLDELLTVKNWRSVANAGSVGRADQGTIVCKTGFFGQGHFNRASIPALTEAMHALRDESLSSR